MKKYITLFFITILAITSIGCTKSESYVKNQMIRNQKEKYQQDIKIKEIHKNPGSSPLADPVYWATAEDSLNHEYRIKSTIDGKEIKDDYAKYLYNAEISQDIENILKLNFEPTEYSYEIVNSLSEQKYDSARKYLLESESYIEIVLTISNKDPEKTAASVYSLVSDLSGYTPFMLRITYNDHPEIVGYNAKDSIYSTYQSILKALQ